MKYNSLKIERVKVCCISIYTLTTSKQKRRKKKKEEKRGITISETKYSFILSTNNTDVCMNHKESNSKGRSPRTPFPTTRRRGNLTLGSLFITLVHVVSSLLPSRLSFTRYPDS